MATPSGYPPECILGKTDNEKYGCPVCSCYVRDPIQVECGHRYCKDCIDILKTDKEHCIKCIEEGELPSSEISILNGFPDRAFKREISKIKCKCLNDQCDWTGELKQYDVHQENCEYKKVTCECGEMISLDKLKKHKEFDCVMRKIPCEKCGKEIIMNQKAKHDDLECPKAMVNCELCGEKLRRDKLEDHQNSGGCRKDREPCRYNNGTTHKIFLSPPEMVKHMEEALQEHLDLLHEIQTKYNNSKHILLKTQMQGDITNLPSTDGVKESVKLNKLETDVESIKESLDIVIDDLGNLLSSDNASTSSDKLKFEAVFCQELERNNDDLRKLKENYDSLSQKYDELSASLTTWKREICYKDLLIEEQKLKIETLQYTSYDGTLIFKLDKFENMKREALMNKLTSHYSVPFYTGRTGYKMCIRVYPNGDGNGRGTHLSIFFVVMRGPYDALLTWPFNKKVTFILLDQSQRGENVTDAFRPDPSSNSFKRPTTEMNIASGSPVFISQTILNQKKDQYIKDDCMFIKVVVETS